jgi:hypothetical protein
MTKALLLLLKAGKLGKLLLTGGTMLLSVIAYSWVFGWWETRFSYGALYLGLAGFLAVMCHELHQQLPRGH